MTIGKKVDPTPAQKIHITPALPTQRDAPRSPSFAPGFAPGTRGEIAAKIGRGIALGFQAWSNAALGAGGTQNMMTQADATPKAYSPDAIAALKGFSSTINIADIQPIWTTVQTTKIRMSNADTCTRAWNSGPEQMGLKSIRESSLK